MGVTKSDFNPENAITLEDKYTATEGKVFMNGTQALVRLPMVQMRRDRAAGLNTGAFISGYRGSPVGGFDFALSAARKHLKDHDIVFQPGVNEDLAATAVWGSQQIAMSPGARKDGVVGMLVRQGPGRRPLRRCLQARKLFRHIAPWRCARPSPVTTTAAKSSTVAHQSDHAFMAAIMPVLFPSSVQEFTELGLLGYRHVPLCRSAGSATR